jgi:hypothetical protein
MSLDLLDLEPDDILESPLLTEVQRSGFREMSNKEIAELQNYVSGLQALLQAIRARSQEAGRQRSTDIKELEISLEAAKVSAQSAEIALLGDQEAEVQAILAQHHDQIQELTRDVSHIDADCAAWNQTSNDLGNLRADVEESSFATGEVRAQNDQEESQAMRANAVNESRVQITLNQERLELRIQSLNEALATAATKRREQYHAHQCLVAECVQGQNELDRIHSSILAGLNKDRQVREQVFKKHLQLVERRVEKEQQQVTTAAGAAKSLFAELNAVRRQAQRQCTRQLDAAQHDIISIENVLKKEHEGKRSASSPAAKTESLAQANAVLRQKIQNLEPQVEHYRAQHRTAIAAVKQSRTPKKTSVPFSDSSPFSYVSRRSTDQFN